MRHRAVIFDLGGVVLDSPLHALARFERERGIPLGFVNRTIVETGEQGAWARLERGEIQGEAFARAFEAECLARGRSLPAAEMLAGLGAAAAPRPAMLEAIAAIRGRGLRAAALTNNWIGEGPGTGLLREHFDVFVESAVLGLRKPDPRIYNHVCEKLGLEPAHAVFLDDIGRNLKPARALGMHTIKVDDPAEALAELERVLGFALRAGAA